ncbi:MAG: hypothetical protein LUE27_05325 [Clostridia bacterium]|nr:hypothetical protein [Clostridia bacterium]
MIFHIKLYDSIILSFEHEHDHDNEDPSKDCRVLYVCKDLSLLPLGMEPTDESVMNWIETRILPLSRDGGEQFLQRMGLSYNDPMGIIQACRGLSLNDSYWVT